MTQMSIKFFFKVVGGAFDKAPNINSDFADSRQTVNISSRSLQSPNVDSK